MIFAMLELEQINCGNMNNLITFLKHFLICKGGIRTPFSVSSKYCHKGTRREYV